VPTSWDVVRSINRIMMMLLKRSHLECNAQSTPPLSLYGSRLGSAPVTVSARFRIANKAPARCINVFEWYRRNSQTPGQLRIKKELERGYWWEWTQLQRDPTGKSVYTADSELAPAAESPQFPEFEARRLCAAASENGSRQLNTRHAVRQPTSGCTLVVVSMHRWVSGPAVDSWVLPFERQPAACTLELMLVPDPLYAAVRPLLEWAVRDQLVRAPSNVAGRPRSSRVAVVSGPPAQHAREALGLRDANRLLPYVFLTDAAGRMRWRAVGAATDTELATATRLASQLAAES